MSASVGIGVVGLGEGGASLARSLAQLPRAELRWICDRDPRVLAEQSRIHGTAQTTRDIRRVLGDSRVEGVVIATPLPTHAEVARQALQAGKDVLAVAPLAFTADEARELVELAASAGRVLVVGHVLLFHPAVRILKQSIDHGELGDIHYLYGGRQHLGSVRRDANVLWSLGPEPVAAALHLIEQEPVSVSAKGASYAEPGGADVVFCHLRFGNGVMASLHLSCLEAESVSKLTVVGSRQMTVFDELSAARLITVYEKGPQHPGSVRAGSHVNPGSIASPSVPAIEPLELECASFVSAIRYGDDPTRSAELGLRVVVVLEALERSLERDGTEEWVRLPADGGNVLAFRARS